MRPHSFEVIKFFHTFVRFRWLNNKYNCRSGHGLLDQSLTACQECSRIPGFFWIFPISYFVISFYRLFVESEASGSETHGIISYSSCVLFTQGNITTFRLASIRKWAFVCFRPFNTWVRASPRSILPEKRWSLFTPGS